MTLIAEAGCGATVLGNSAAPGDLGADAEELRAHLIPFVTLTGFSNEQQPAAFLGATLLSKAILPEQVVSAVKCCLEERR